MAELSNGSSHCTTITKAYSLNEIIVDMERYHEQENEPMPDIPTIAYDLIRLISVGLVLVEEIKEEKHSTT